MTPFWMGVFATAMIGGGLGFFTYLIIRHAAYSRGYEEGYEVGWRHGYDLGYTQGKWINEEEHTA